jgi:hypothetical protein
LPGITHLFTRLTLLLTALFTTAVLVVRARPLDDGVLRALLQPPADCPMPCFMGIRPGVSAIDEALAILESHEWVERIEFRRPEGSYAHFYMVTWSGQQPELIDAEKNGVIVSVYNFRLRQRIVRNFRIPLRAAITLGDLYSALGKAPTTAVEAFYGGGAVFNFLLRHEYDYADSSLSFSTYHDCVYDRKHFLDRPVRDVELVIAPQVVQPSNIFRPVNWRQIVQHFNCW